MQENLTIIRLITLANDSFRVFNIGEIRRKDICNNNE